MRHILSEWAVPFSCRSNAAVREKSMPTAYDMSHKIERNSDAERHFGVSLESLSVFLLVDDDGDSRMSVAGEVAALGRGSLSRNLTIIASAHDLHGRVLGVSKDMISVDGFYELQAFSMSDYATLPSSEIEKIKIYPCGY